MVQCSVKILTPQSIIYIVVIDIRYDFGAG